MRLRSAPLRRKTPGFTVFPFGGPLSLHTVIVATGALVYLAAISDRAHAQAIDDPEVRLKALGLSLPASNRPAGNYVNAVRTGNLLFLATHGECGTSMSGKVGAGISRDSAYASAKRVGLCLIATLKAELGDLRRVVRIVRVTGMVNAAPDFTELPAVINGASDLMVAVFGDRGKHARGVIAVPTMAGGRAVGVEMVVEIRDTGQFEAQAPAGLAASALADTSFRWIHQSAPGFRVYFARDTYPAARQDSLLGRLPRALSHAREMIGAPELTEPIDLFFIESRAQMARLIRGSATGFAQPSTRTVFLVTNPEWRAFEQHEVMHVVAQHAWGPPAPGNDWLVEGLAQAADGTCAGYSNADVALRLSAGRGWIPLDTMLTRFRSQPDLRAYLQAAAFVDYLVKRHGAAPLAAIWRAGSRPDSRIGAQTLAESERRWREELRPSRRVPTDVLAAVESKGCG